METTGRPAKEVPVGAGIALPHWVQKATEP